MNTSIFPGMESWNHGLARQAYGRISEPREPTRRTSQDKLELVLGATIKWARAIPSELRPRALVIKYPRIANALADAWSQPKLFNMLLCQLMLDDRGSRQGFPFDVLQDLANLRVYFDSRYKHPGTDIWCSVSDRYKRI